MPAVQAPMSGSWRIGTFAGIGVYVHWTFFLLPAVLAGTELVGTGPLADRLLAAAYRMLLIVAIFACVVLHEFGHALTARRFGIGTRDIVLLPIGGVARLERIPRNPTQELWIALAGPAVNIVIASLVGVLLLIIGLVRGELMLAVQAEGLLGFLTTMVVINIVLVVFNMIPAFPMDGGRVLRATLAFRMDYGRATDVAARVGQVIALIFVAVGLYFSQFMLILVAVMVFMGAKAEARQTRVVSRLAGLRVREAMMTEFRAVGPDVTLDRCAEFLLASSQTEFPVVSDAGETNRGQYLGMLTRDRLLSAISQGRGADAVSEHLDTRPPLLDPLHSAAGALELLQSAGVAAAPALQDGTLVGLVTIENIAELLELRASRASPVRIGRPSART